MNPSTNQASVAAEELAPPCQPHRLSTSCDIHPDECFSGFCPSCLCERLSVLDHNGAPPQPSSSSSRKPPTISAATLKALFLPELRRTKSFSGKNKEGLSGGFEPQRRSCDVRLREEHRNVSTKGVSNMEEEARKSSVSEVVLEVNEEEESGEIVKEEEKEEMKAMKEYMDLYPQPKKRFFSAASVFSKKLQKWRHKQKLNKKHLPTRRDTQSEIADAPRSSDTDPRFSLDEPRASWDGHLTGRTTLPPTVRVLPPPSMHRSDMQIPVEDTLINGESEEPTIMIPGGSRDYYTEPPSSIDRSNSMEKESYSKKSKRWSILGFIFGKGVVSKQEDRYSRSNSTGMVERSLSESWPELGGPPKMRRSNSNVSWRSSRNKNWRNSSKDGGDNGMLRFYLTPTWTTAGGGTSTSTGWGKTAARANSHGHSIARRVMRLY